MQAENLDYSPYKHQENKYRQERRLAVAVSLYEEEKSTLEGMRHEIDEIGTQVCFIHAGFQAGPTFPFFKIIFPTFLFWPLQFYFLCH